MSTPVPLDMQHNSTLVFEIWERKNYLGLVLKITILKWLYFLPLLGNSAADGGAVPRHHSSSLGLLILAIYLVCGTRFSKVDGHRLGSNPTWYFIYFSRTHPVQEVRYYPVVDSRCSESGWRKPMVGFSAGGSALVGPGIYAALVLTFLESWNPIEQPMTFLRG